MSNQMIKAYLFKKIFRKYDSDLEKVQLALVIRGFGICGFDYSRTRKQEKPANNEGKNTV